MREAGLSVLPDSSPEGAPVLPALACRELEPSPGPVSRASLVLDLACVHLPARTGALLTGRGGERGSVEERVFRWAHARLRSLVGALLSGDARVASYRSDAAALTGLGPGLTPTGDDLLVGLAAMSRRLVGGGLVEARAAAAFGTAIAGLPAGETTPAAQDLLRNASEGRFPAILASVVEMIGNPHADAGSILTLTRRLAALGAHSGADLLAGALALVHGVVEARESR